MMLVNSIEVSKSDSSKRSSRIDKKTGEITYDENENTTPGQRKTRKGEITSLADAASLFG